MKVPVSIHPDYIDTFSSDYHESARVYQELALQRQRLNQNVPEDAPGLICLAATETR